MPDWWCCSADYPDHAKDCPSRKEEPVTAEELARALFDATENLDSEFGRWAETFDELEDVGRKMWVKSATAIMERFEVRRK